MTLNRVNYKKLIIPILIGLIIWFCSPIKPAAVSITAWHMFAIFVATIIGCITQPIPIAGVALIGLTLSVLLGVVSIDIAMSGFGNGTVWMIGMAYFLSRGFIKTGLGRRVALIFVRLFGKRTLGLAYSLIGVDLITAPAMPSDTARAGGIVFPIIKSLSETYGSNPKDGTQRKVGAFLIFSEFHGDIITSAMFMTGMASNLIVPVLAKNLNVHLTWLLWFEAGIVPAIISLVLVPLIIYKLYPPEIKDTPNAKQWAEKELADMGKVCLAEKIMATIFILALVLWMTASLIGLDATTVAFLAISLLLVTGVLTVDDILKETGAWNTIIWFSILIFMANELNSLGFISWLSKFIGQSMQGVNWVIVLVVLVLFYFYSHYLFASVTAHVSAMYSALLAVAISAGAPPVFSALLLGFIGAVFASTTQYASGPASVLYGSGYVTQKDWWKLNFILGIFYLIVWAGIGSLWMKLIGIW